MRDPLSRLDSATLRAWRATNVVVWTLAAFLTAMVTHVAAVRLVHALPLDGSTEPSLESVGLVVLQAAVSVVAGLTAGGVLGAKAWRRPPVLAGVAASGYVLVAVFILWPGGLDVLGIYPGRFGESPGTSALLAGCAFAQVLAIPAAVVWARRISVRRLV